MKSFVAPLFLLTLVFFFSSCAPSVQLVTKTEPTSKGTKKSVMDIVSVYLEPDYKATLFGNVTLVHEMEGNTRTESYLVLNLYTSTTVEEIGEEVNFMKGEEVAATVPFEILSNEITYLDSIPRNQGRQFDLPEFAGEQRTITGKIKLPDEITLQEMGNGPGCTFNFELDGDSWVLSVDPQLFYTYQQLLQSAEEPPLEN